ncbi:hypothetical protein ABBQ38_000692 [Trebouxia sp. C0009 RCD-2024]
MDRRLLIFWVLCVVKAQQQNISLLAQSPRPAVTKPLDAGLLKTSAPGQRTNLVVAAVGDSSIHERWFEDFEYATWDLAVFYFGKRDDFSCDKCVYVESGSGTKWSFLYKFGKSDVFQKKFAKQYQQLYVTDDDIVQTSHTISRAFALMQQYGLLLAQPSLCSPFESTTWLNPLYKDARVILQYTTFVEIMVPIFNMKFFTSKVVDTLENAETGHGLDWVWPFVMGYPQEKIAIINDVCVVHPKKELQPGSKLTIYKEHNPHAEHVAVLAKFGYEAEILKKKYDMGYLQASWLGRRWQPWYQDLLDLAGIKDTYEVRNAAQGPHKGSKFVSADTGAPGVARLRRRHHIHTMTDAFKLLGFQNDGQRPNIAGAPNLVIVSVPKQSRWLRSHPSAQYDLIAMAAADEVEMVQKECPHCLLVYNHGLDHVAGRYAALYKLIQTKQWQNKVADKYEYIYFPEEEIVQSVDSVNRLFELSKEYKLELSHPSWCSPEDTVSWHMDLLKMHATTLLRRTTYVETAAPLWSRSFWKTYVAPHLKNVDRGFGLDFVWPYLADYPEDQVAVIDDTCVMRPTHILGPSPLMKATKLSQDELTIKIDAEEINTLIDVDYNPNKLRHIAYKPQDVMNWELQPWYQEMLSMNHLLVTPVRRWEMRLIIDPST